METIREKFEARLCNINSGDDTAVLKKSVTADIIISFIEQEVFKAYADGKSDGMSEMVDTCKKEVSRAVAEREAEMKNDMLDKMHNWHGSGIAMIADYFSSITEGRT